MDEREIYLEECGCECPYGKEGDCSYCDGGICTMEDPWFDCDDFMTEYENEIANAENRLF